MLGVKITLPCFKKVPLNPILILELFILTNFGETLWFAVKGGLTFLFENPLDSDSAIVFGG